MFLGRVGRMSLANANRAQLHMLREPGLLRSVLITVLDLAHVHAARAPGLAPWPPQKRTRSKKRDAHTQLQMLHEPGLLRSVLVTALGLAHVHAAPADRALFLPDVSLFASVFFWGRAQPPCLLRSSPSQPSSGHRAET